MPCVMGGPGPDGAVEVRLGLLDVGSCVTVSDAGVADELVDPDSLRAQAVTTPALDRDQSARTDDGTAFWAVPYVMCRPRGDPAAGVRSSAACRQGSVPR